MTVFSELLKHMVVSTEPGLEIRSVYSHSNVFLLTCVGSPVSHFSVPIQCIPRGHISLTFPKLNELNDFFCVISLPPSP